MVGHWTPEEYARAAEVIARTLREPAWVETGALVAALDRTGRKTPEERQRGLLAVADIVRPPGGESRRVRLAQAGDVQLALGEVDRSRLDDMELPQVQQWLRSDLRRQFYGVRRRRSGGRPPGRRGRYGRVHLKDGMDQLDPERLIPSTLARPGVSPERIVQQRERRDRLFGVVTPAERELLVLLFQGRTYPDIAARLGWKVGTIDDVLTRIRRKAREID